MLPAVFMPKGQHCHSVLLLWLASVSILICFRHRIVRYSSGSHVQQRLVYFMNSCPSILPLEGSLHARHCAGSFTRNTICNNSCVVYRHVHKVDTVHIHYCLVVNCVMTLRDVLHVFIVVSAEVLISEFENCVGKPSNNLGAASTRSFRLCFML